MYNAQLNTELPLSSFFLYITHQDLNQYQTLKSNFDRIEQQMRSQ